MDLQSLFGKDIWIPMTVKKAILALTDREDVMKVLHRVVRNLKEIQETPEAYNNPVMIRNGDQSFVEDNTRIMQIIGDEFEDQSDIENGQACYQFFVALTDRYFKVFNLQPVTDTLYLLFDDKCTEGRVARAHQNSGAVEVYSNKAIADFRPVNVNTFIRNTFERNYEGYNLAATMETTLATFTKQGQVKYTSFLNRLVLRDFSRSQNEDVRMKALGVIVHSVAECPLDGCSSFYELFQKKEQFVIERLFGKESEIVEDKINAVFDVECPEGFANWLLEGRPDERIQEGYSELYDKLDRFINDISDFCTPISYEYANGLNRLT